MKLCFFVIWISLLSNAAGLVFSDGFESGNVNKWEIEPQHSACNVVNKSAADSKLPHSGNFQAECNWNGTLDWTNPNQYQQLKQSFNVKNEIFVRFWVRYQPDVDTSPDDAYGGKMGRVTTQVYSDLDQYYWGLHGGESFVWTSVVDNGSPGARWRNADFTDNIWHKIEFYFKAGVSTAGVSKVWVDGIKLIDESMTNISKTGNTYNTFYMMSNWSGGNLSDGTYCCGHDDKNHISWDDFEVYSDNGTGATGLMSDASIKASSTTPLPNLKAPTNLRIVL